MDKTRSSFYAFSGTVLAAGAAWAVLSFRFSPFLQPLWKGCFMKQFLHLPCPSCGTTRSVLSLAQGQWTDAFFFNPLGFVLGPLLLVLPFWWAFDLWTGRQGLWNAYQQCSRKFSTPNIWIPTVFLLLLNWFWNIAKGY
jgi:hypothetical protein